MRKRSPIALAGGTLLLAYALVLLHHTSFAAGGSDSSGYLNAARLFASGRISGPVRGLARLALGEDFTPIFIPLGFTPGPRPGTMAPTYPPGLPLHMAAAALVGGWAKAPFLVSPLAALACLVLVYALARELGLPPAFALAGSALLAFSPPFVFQAVQPMSDVVATAWGLAAVFAAYRACSRGSALWAAASGAAFGIGILVRPTNVLVLLPLLFVLPIRRKAWLPFVAAGAPFAVFLLAYDAALFGNVLTTGYGSNFAEAMAWANFPERARHYGYWTARLLSPLLPLGWLAFAMNRRAALLDRLVLVSWFVAFFVFYSFYAPYETWWYTRFLLPGFPALVLGALLAAHHLARGKRWATAAAAVMLAGALFVEIQFVAKNRVHEVYEGERMYPEACEMARRRVPANGIVLSMQLSGALHYYTGATYAMWNWLDADRFAVLRTSTESRGYRWYALLAPYEMEEVRKNLVADWREVDRVSDVELWELAPALR